MNDLSMAFAGPPGPGLTTEQQSQLDALPDWVADIETAVRQNAPNAGELLPEVKGLNLAVPLAVTGVTAIADEDGAPIGFTIAANQSGGAAALFGYPLHDNRTIRDLKGQTVYLLARYWATANFLTLKPLSPLYVDVGRYQGDNQGAPVYEGQVGNELIRIVKYTVQGDEDCLGIIAQVLPGAAPTVTPMTLRLQSLTYLVEGDVAATISKAISGLAAGRFGASIIAEVQQASGVLAGGATFLRNANTNYINGLRTPAGANGAGSSVSPYWLLQSDDFPLIQGARARVTIISKLSVPFDRKIDIYASGHIRAVGGGFLDEYRMLSDRYEDGYRIRTIEGIFDAGTEQVTINFNDVSTTVAAAAQQFQADDILIEIIETANGQMSGAQATMALQRNILSRNPRRPMGPEISVAPSGGDFTSCFAAIANIVAGQPINLQSARYEYTGSTLVTRPFFPTFEGLVVRGVGAEMPVISLTQPNNTAPLATSDPNVASIEGNSAADLHFGLELDWVAFEIENGRYAIHIDASNLYYDQHMKLGHVRATHRGNEKAKSYQQSIGNDPAIVWKNCAAVGIGLGSGGVLEIERLDAFGYKSTAVIAHNWNATKAPMRLVIKTGIMDPRDPTGLSDSFYYANSGSLHNDLLDFGDVVMPAPLCFGSSPWMPIDPALCPANKMTFTAIGRGRNVVYRLEDDGSRALRITSATTGASSSIAVSGSGADQTMGPAAKRTTVAGATDVAGSVTGWIDVGDHKIGPGSDLDIVRLGKRITTGSALSVAIDGDAPINISLTGNLSQADTLAAIQTALGSAAIVELVNLNDLFRPLFAHEETRVFNAGATTMQRKHAVAWSGTGKPSARVMTPADDVEDFAGIVYGRDIPPGEWGRIKIGGQVRVSMDIARSDGVAFEKGDIFVVSTSDGKLAVGAGPGVLAAVSERDVAVGTSQYAMTQAAVDAEAEARANLITGDTRNEWSLIDTDVHGRRRFGVKLHEISTPLVGVALDDDQREVRLLGPDGQTPLRVVSDVQDPRWSFAAVDDVHQRVVFGITPGGVLYPPQPIETRLAPLPVTLNRGALRQIGYARSRFSRDSSFKMNIGIIGDSFIASSYRWLQNVVYGPHSLYGTFGDGGAGWVSLVTGNGRGNTGYYQLNGPGSSSNASWLVQRRNAGNISPDISSITPLVAGAAVQLLSPSDSVPLSSMKLIYKAAAACQIRYRFNAGAWTVVDLATTGGVTALAFTGLPTSPGWVMDMEVVSGATELYGLMLDSSNSGANISVMGVSGSATSDWVNMPAADWQQGIALLGIKTWFVMLATNDQSPTNGQARPNTPAEWIANIDTLVTRLRAADPACDVCILVPPENFDPTRITTPMVGYENALRDYCDTHPQVAGLIMQSAVGVAGGDYSATGAWHLWDADGIHPDPSRGGPVMAAFFLHELFNL